MFTYSFLFLFRLYWDWATEWLLHGMEMGFSLNWNRYFDDLSTDKWEWLDIFILFLQHISLKMPVCLFIYLFWEIWEHISSCEHNKLATSMLVSSHTVLSFNLSLSLSVHVSSEKLFVHRHENGIQWYVVYVHSHFISHHDTTLLLTARRILSQFTLLLTLTLTL